MFTPLQPLNKQLDAASINTTAIITDRRGMGDVTNVKPGAQKSLDFNQDSANKSLQNSLTSEMNYNLTPERTTRRSSSTHLPCIPDLSKEYENFEPRMTRRRSMLNLSKTMDVVENNTSKPQVNNTTYHKKRRRTSYQYDMSISTQSTEQTSAKVTRRRSTSSMSMDISTPKVIKKPSIQSIAEETLNNNTNFEDQTMQLTPSQNIRNERRKVYATKTLEVSDFDENINPYLDKTWERNVEAQPSLDSFVTTKTSPESFEDGTPVFSSTRLPRSSSETSKQTNRRRSLFNVDLELAKERIIQMNSTSESQALALANVCELGQCIPLAPLQAVTTNVPTDDKVTESAEPKMRRLFTPNDEVVVSPPKSVKQTRKSIAPENRSVSSNIKRRRTLAGTATPGTPSTSNVSQSKENIKDSSSDIPINIKTTSKRQIILKTLVHTNMHRDEVQNIHKVRNTATQR